MFKKLRLKKILKQAGYKWIDVPKEIIEEYRNKTRKNKDLSDFKIQFKLNREYYSAQLHSINDIRYIDIVYYGYLEIVKDNKRNMIIKIHNSKSNRCGQINYNIKNEINSIYESVFGGDTTNV